MGVNATLLLQFAISGLKNGAIYSLVALGFTIVYASTGIINFAQGEFFMLGGMLSVFALRTMGLPLFPALLFGVAGTAMAGVVFERLALRPRRDSGSLTLIIMTIGGSITLKSLARHAFGPDELALPPFTAGASLSVLGATVERQTLWVWALTAVAVVVLAVVYRKTGLGRAMRACAVSHEASRLMGIDTARIVMIGFGLAAALGAIGGLAVAPLTQTSFDVGARIGLKGFSAAILGGLGDPVAAVVGGILLGLLESMSIAFLSSTYKDVISLAVLLAVLFVRPQGILGRANREKV